MINRKHDKWILNEADSFICYHVVRLACRVFVLTGQSSPNLLFLLDTPGPLTPNNIAITLITDQTNSVSVALGLNFLE